MIRTPIQPAVPLPSGATTVTYAMTADEMARAGQLLLSTWIRRAGKLVPLLLLLVGVVLLASGRPDPGTTFVLVGLIMWAAGPVSHWVAVRRFATILKKMPEPIVVTIAADGIHGTQGQTSWNLGWGDVEGVEVKGEFLFVRARLRLAYAIPLRAFNRPTDFDRFMATARAFMATSGQSVPVPDGTT